MFKFNYFGTFAIKKLILYGMNEKVCNGTEKKLSIDDFPGLKAIKEELLKRGYKKVE